MQILFKHPRPEHPFWRKSIVDSAFSPSLFALKPQKCSFSVCKCHFCPPQMPLSSGASAIFIPKCHFYPVLALRVLEFSSTSTQCKCHNSTCFYEITPQQIKYQYVTFLVLSTLLKLAKNAPTICFLIFCALLSGQTYKYRVKAKGVPRTRGKVLHSQEPTEEHTQQRTTISRSCLYLCVDNKLSHPFAVFALLKHIPKRMI